MSMAVPVECWMIENTPKISIEDDYFEKLEMTEASGEIVSFMNDLVPLPFPELKANIVAQQDLHGYDHPWVGGAGKNIFNNTASTTTLNGVKFTVNSDGSVTATGTATADTNFQLIGAAALESILTSGQSYVLSGTPNGGSTDTYFMRLNVSGKNDIGYGIVLNPYNGSVLGNWSIRIASGYAISGSLLFKPMIEKGSTKTAFEPYSNICPISGWDEVNVYVRGINIWDEEWVNGRWAGNNGVLNTAFSSYVACKNKIPVVPNSVFYFVINGNPSGSREIVWYDKNGNWISDEISYYVNRAYTVPSNAYFITFNLGGAYGNTYNHDISINYPSTDTDYHAYNGQTYTIDLDGTRYGGTLDVTTGVLTLTHEYVDMGDLTWSYNSTAQVFWKNFATMKRPCILVCSQYKYQPDGNIENLVNGEIWNRAYAYTPNNVVVKDTAYTDATAFKNALTANNAQLVYELATPQTVQLTAQQVKMLAGQNNIWSDIDEVEVKYYVKA